jgi:hypothetical protein
VDVELPDDWSVGVIVGDSMAGKTTLARELFGDWSSAGAGPGRRTSDRRRLPRRGSRTRSAACCRASASAAAGRGRSRTGVLSNGGKFRVEPGPGLAERERPLIDEFGSVRARPGAARRRGRGGEDRPTAQAAARGDHLPRRRVDYFEPDWVIRLTARRARCGRRQGGCFGDRPSSSRSSATDPSAWARFRPHHYLSARSAPRGEVLRRADRDWPAGRVHRRAAVPARDAPGLARASNGLPARLSGRRRWERDVGVRRVALRGDGQAVHQRDQSPAMIRHRAKSPLWRMTRAPSNTSARRGSPKQRVLN